MGSYSSSKQLFPRRGDTTFTRGRAAVGADMCRAKVGVHWDYPGGKTRPVNRSLESSPLIQGKVTSGGHRRSSSFIVVILFTSKQNKSAVKAMYSGSKKTAWLKEMNKQDVTAQLSRGLRRWANRTRDRNTISERLSKDYPECQIV